MPVFFHKMSECESMGCMTHKRDSYSFHAHTKIMYNMCLHVDRETTQNGSLYGGVDGKALGGKMRNTQSKACSTSFLSDPPSSVLRVEQTGP